MASITRSVEIQQAAADLRECITVIRRLLATGNVRGQVWDNALERQRVAELAWNRINAEVGAHASTAMSLADKNPSGPTESLSME